MGASASLSRNALSVEPGAQVTCELTVRNTGQIVDQVTVDVVGNGAGWATAEPSSLNLFPNDEATVTITFSPPRAHTTPAGPTPFGVRAISKEDPQGSSVEEGVVDVGRFIDTDAELVPKTSRGRRRATHELAVDNRGNAPLNAEIHAFDDDNLLDFETEPPTLVGEPGTATFGRVIVKPKKRFLRGKPKTIPFRVQVTYDDHEPISADGSMLQEQLLPKWLIPLLIALFAIAVILFVLWLTVLSPAIDTAAREALQSEAEEQEVAVMAAQEAAEEAAAAAQDATALAEAAGVDQDKIDQLLEDGGASGSGGSGGILDRGDGVDIRIAADDPPVGPTDPNAPIVASAFTVIPWEEQPEDKVLLVTDIVFQNPLGDDGIIRVLRGDEILLEIGLGNFRDLDYHFVAPYQFDQDEQLSIAVLCHNPDPPGLVEARSCQPAVSFSGVLATPEDAPAEEAAP